MLKYIIKRLLLGILTFFIITIMVFFLIKLLPYDYNTVPPGRDPELHAKIIEEWGYNKPVGEQFLIFMERAFLNGDWGYGTTMYTNNVKVNEIFMEKLPFTLYINIFAELISVPVGLALGIWAALKKNKMTDHVISTGVMILVSVPSFVLAFLIQYLVCFRWNLLPLRLIAGTGAEMFTWKYFVSALAPILALSFGTVAGLTRFTRAELTEVLTSEFMLLARTKGLTKTQATTRHALRNAMVPILPMIIGGFISIIAGSLIIERIFGVPGVGSLMVESIGTLDYNYFMCLSCFYTAINLIAGLVIDLSYGFIDPRIRMGAR